MISSWKRGKKNRKKKIKQTHKKKLYEKGAGSRSFRMEVRPPGVFYAASVVGVGVLVGIEPTDHHQASPGLAVGGRELARAFCVSVAILAF